MPLPSPATWPTPSPATGWIHSDPDTNQWVKPLSTTHFWVIEGSALFDIDVDTMRLSEVRAAIAPFYSDLGEIGASSDAELFQIVAECVAEGGLAHPVLYDPAVFEMVDCPSCDDEGRVGGVTCEDCGGRGTVPVRRG